MSKEPFVLPDTLALYEHASCALLVTTTTGLILQVNQTFCSWLGYASVELVGVSRLQELLTVGGRIFYQTHWLPLLELQRSIAEVKLDFKTRDGQTLPMALNATRRQHGASPLDEVSAFLVVQRHRFERELLIAKAQAEAALDEHIALQRELSVADARLRIALESAQLYVWDVEPQTLERRYDDRVAHLLGFSTAQPVTMAAFASFIDPQDIAAETREFERALKSPGHEYRCMYRLNGADGVQRTILATGRGVLDADARLLQFVGVLHDITEVSRQRGAAEDRALFAEQMIGIVSHDLRNPLQVISMAAQYLQSHGTDNRQMSMLVHIRDATQRAQRLINDLLDFTQARIGHGLAIRKVHLALEQVIGQGVEALRLAYPGRHIEYVPHGHLDCHADADRLIQLIGNLVSNAMAYGDPAGAVTISTSTLGQGFQIQVHNWGTPIAPDLLLTLFQPMTRGAEIAREVRSVGLGLYIVEEIAKAHGGDVVVTSDAQAGTTFTIRLPLQ